jgi:hypothetical protein
MILPTLTRPVIVSEWQCCEVDYAFPHKPTRELVPRGQAQFHGWGCEIEEFDNGAVNQTVAIIEWPDGKVEAVLPHCIQFVLPLRATES